ncbi:MAG TPA: holo-ACP synthase, partial [Limnochordia bacterium]
RAALERRGSRFARRILTGAELSAKPARTAGSASVGSAGRDETAPWTARQIEWLAGRFAAKEAVMKALGTGWRAGVSWREIEIIRLPSGEPRVRLSGRAEAAARRRGVSAVWVSISHDRRQAIAQAVAVQDDPARPGGRG